MDRPIERLPPELLVSAFCLLNGEEKTLCKKTCRRWQAVIKTHWTYLNIPPLEMLYDAARKGRIKYLMVEKEQGQGDFCAATFDSALKAAAKEGQAECALALRMWRMESRLVELDSLLLECYSIISSYEHKTDWLELRRARRVFEYNDGL